MSSADIVPAEGIRLRLNTQTLIVVVLAVAGAAMSQFFLNGQANATTAQQFLHVTAMVKSEGEHTREIARMQYHSLGEQINGLGKRIEVLEARTHKLETSSSIYAVPNRNQ